VVGSFDHSDEPDEPDPPERRGRPGKDGSSDRVEGSGNADRSGSSAESESRAAERLGLTTLTRGEFYESQRSQADAQEAALQRRDAAASIDQSDQSNEPRTDTRAPGEAADSRQADEPRTDDQVPGETADSRSARDAAGAATDDAGPSARDVAGAVTDVSSAVTDVSSAASDDAGPDKVPWGRSGPKRDAPDIGGERWWSHPPEERPERDVEIHRGYYWTEVPRFLANWQHIEKRWPGNRRSEADGPVSGEGDSRYDVSPERRARTMEAVDKLPEAEPSISDNVKRVEVENVRGGWVEGYEFRLKGKERLTEKVLEALEAQQDSTPEEVVSRIPDAIRYPRSTA
jgi:hypothetical protein